MDVMSEPAVSHVSVEDAKLRLGDLVERAAEWEDVAITRAGKAVARITAVEWPSTPIDVAALRALTDTMPMQDAPAGECVRLIRDDARY